MSIISVIVPVYNVEKYLERCLDSILSQTLAADLEFEKMYNYFGRKFYNFCS